jgi:hypothetical protein
MRYRRRRRRSQGLSIPNDRPTETRRPDCGVIAVAVAAGVDYWKAWNILRAVGGYSGRWKGVTSTSDRTMALRRLGRRRPKKITLPRGMTVKTFLRDFATPGVRYWIHTYNHIVTALVQDGDWQLIDQDHYANRSNDHTLRQRVEAVYEL